MKAGAQGACLGVGGGSGAPERAVAAEALCAAARGALAAAGLGAELGAWTRKGAVGSVAPRDPHASLYL